MRTWAAAQAVKGSPNTMPMPNPRQSIYALRGWIDRIEQDARADAAKKYGTLDEAKPATPPEAEAARLLKEHAPSAPHTLL